MAARLVVIWLVLFLACPAVAFTAPKPPKAVVDRNKDGIVDRKEILREKTKVDTRWEKKADLDRDGRVEAGELKAWRHHKAKVNTEVESKYDANSDGWLEPDEAREYLKDRYRVIKTHGKAVVNTAAEAEYDANNDGIIDVGEAEAMRNDLE